MSWALINQNRLLIIQIQTLPASMHHKWNKLLILYENQLMGNQREATPDVKSHQLQDNFYSSVKLLTCVDTSHNTILVG